MLRLGIGGASQPPVPSWRFDNPTGVLASTLSSYNLALTPRGPAKNMTIVLRGTFATPVVTSANLMEIHEGTNNNRFHLRIGSGGQIIISRNRATGTLQSLANSYVTATDGAAFGICGRISDDGTVLDISVNGNPVESSGDLVGVIGAPTTLIFGKDYAGSSVGDFTVRGAAIFNEYLASDDTMRRLSIP